MLKLYKKLYYQKEKQWVSVHFSLYTYDIFTIATSYSWKRVTFHFTMHTCSVQSLVSKANFHEDIRRTPKRSQTNAVIVAKLFHTAAIFSSIKTLNWVRSWVAIYYMRALSQCSIHKDDLHYTQTPAQFFSSVYTPGMSKCIHLCFLQWYNNHGNAVSVAKYFSHNSQLESHLRTHIGDKP